MVAVFLSDSPCNFTFQLKVCPKRLCISTVGVRRDLFRRNPDKVLITDFFGAVRPIEVVAAMDTNWPQIAGLTLPNRFGLVPLIALCCLFLLVHEC